MRYSISSNVSKFIVVATLSLLSQAAISATVLFSDNTFDLTDYTIDSYQSGGADVIRRQLFGDGNPSPALQTIYDVPAVSSEFYARDYYVNSGFSYDPGVQGKILSIDFKADYYFAMDPGPVARLGVVALLSQNGSYYGYRIPLSVTNGIWQTGEKFGLSESDFDLIIDPLTSNGDDTKHPDFANGTIHFGVLQGATLLNGTSTGQIFDNRHDNVEYTLHAVPAPSAIALFASALGAFGFLAKRKAAAQVIA